MTDEKDATSGELAGQLSGDDLVLLDIRPIAAYNGWALRDEPRGGHIRGASAFPLEWTNSPDWSNLLNNKGITPDKKVVVYGYATDDTEQMAAKLAAVGFDKVHTYDRFMDWSRDESCPMDRLEQYRHLVYPEWVRTLIEGRRPPMYDGQPFLVCHASYRYREDYESGHIPGAVHLDTEFLEESKTWNRRTPEEIRRACQDLGISRDKTVVLYGRFSHPNNEDEYPGRMAGHLAAMRCAQILLYAGVKDVRILNGGMAAWKEAGFEITTEEGVITPVSDFGGDIPEHPELIVDTPKAKELLAAEDGELVSIRSWDEFVGNVSGYNYIEKVGRIPGAIFGNCGSDAYHMENYRNHDHTMRSFHEIESVWAATGITPDKHVAFYCGTGWRASEAFFHAWLMGWPKVSVYDGGWLEWSSDPDNPVAIGEPEEKHLIWR